MNVNKAIILGNLTQDPELRTTPSGQNVASFGVATNRFWIDKKTNEKKQEVSYHNIVAWGRLAEIAEKYLQKGSMVYIEGRIHTRSWEDKNGNKKYRTEIIAERMQLGPKKYEEKDDSQTKPAQEESIPEEEVDVDEIPF